LRVYLFTYLFTYYLFIYLLFIYLLIIYLFTYYLFIYLFIHLFIYLVTLHAILGFLKQGFLQDAKFVSALQATVLFNNHCFDLPAVLSNTEKFLPIT